MLHPVPTPDDCPAPLQPGESLTGDLEVVAHLSRNESLDVYDVWSHSRGCRAVAKLLRPDELDDPRSRFRLEREARALLAATHPHIVRAYEFVEEPFPVLVLETLTGFTVSGLLAEFPAPALTDHELAHLGLHLCSAVDYLHAMGLLHLDVKPGNVISDGGRAKLLDLSLARPPGEVHAGVGTRQYMAPEQAAGGVLGPAADVWGIGALLFAVATGRRPLEPFDETERYPQLERDPVRLSSD